MNCPNCDQLAEEDAAFCGNCGHRLSPHAPKGRPVGSHIASVLAHQSDSGTRDVGHTAPAGMPHYAVASPLHHVGEAKAVLSVLLGVLGIAGAFFAALIGLTLGIAGLVFGTLARNSLHRRTSTAGIIVSALAIVVSLGVWSFVIHRQNNSANAEPTKTTNAIAAADVSTPCYATGFIETLNVTNTKDSCNMSAFNGRTLEASTKAYKVYANQIASVNDQTFNAFAKEAVKNDIAATLPGFSIKSEEFTDFAGSPAYIAHASDKQGVKVTEAVVLRQTRSGVNVFVLVHASSKGQTDLSTLEAQWQWK